MPVYDLCPKFNLEVKILWFFIVYLLHLCAFVMSIQYFYKQGKKKENMFITQRTTCLFILVDATWTGGGPSGCLDCSRGYWRVGSEKREGTMSKRSQGLLTDNKQGETQVSMCLPCAGHASLCTVCHHSVHHPCPHSFIHSFTRCILSTYKCWAVIGPQGYSCEQNRQKSPL